MNEKKDRVRSPLERRMKIIEMAFRSERPLRTGDLAAQFGIKQNLLAYDLNALVSLGLIERGHGWVAARRRKGAFEGTEFAARQGQNQGAKKGIATYIAAQLHNAGTVILDAGSTTLAIAEELVKSETTLDVFTNNLALLLSVADAPGITCHVIGGDYSHHQAAAVGPAAPKAIESWKFPAGVLAPRALTFIPPEHAQAKEMPNASAVSEESKRMGREYGLQIGDVASRSLFLSLYSADHQQRPMKSMLIKNTEKLFIAADYSKLFPAGEPFFTIIIPTCLEEAEGLKSDASPASFSLLAPVRSRGPVRVRRAFRQAEEEGEETEYSDLNASVDTREPGFTVLVTSTDDHDEVPAELLRQLRTLKSAFRFEKFEETIRSTIVVVNRKGEPVPFDVP